MLLKLKMLTEGPSPFHYCLFKTGSGPSTGLKLASSMSQSYSSSTSMEMQLPRLTSSGGEASLVSFQDEGRQEGLESGRGGGSRDSPASGWGRDHAGTTTHDVGSAVTNVVGGSTEVFTSDCEQLFRSLSSHSRSFTWLCSFVSTASVL